MGNVFNFFDKLKKVLNKTGSVFGKIVWPIMFIAFLGLLLVALLFVCPGWVLIIPFLCIGVFLSFVWKKYICPIWKVNGECPNCKKSLFLKNFKKVSHDYHEHNKTTTIHTFRCKNCGYILLDNRLEK